VPLAGYNRARRAILTLGLLSVATLSPAQERETPPPDPVFVADSRTLARIQEALDREPVVGASAAGRRFYLEIVGRPPTWQEYMAGSHGLLAITPTTPPGDRPGGGALGGGAGIDLLGIFRSVGRAMRERETRQIRERIDRELRALERAPATGPGESADAPAGDDSP
jgi:hypothetical protein